jgi:hypothetical protein
LATAQTAIPLPRSASSATGIQRAQIQTDAGSTGAARASAESARTDAASSDSLRLVKSINEISRRASIARDEFAAALAPGSL